MARIEELITYCLVIDEKSFTRAAERLQLSQPAVSMQIKTLENEYKEKLLHRDGKEILPTESGEIVYQYASQIIELDRRSKQLVHESRETSTGRLSIASSSGPGERLLPKILGSYKKSYPSSEISLRVGDSDEIINQIIKYRYELGFVGISRRDSQLQFDPFLKDELVLAVNPDHKWAKEKQVDFSQVQKEPLILQQYGSGATAVLSKALAEYDLSIQDLNITMELGLQESARTAVESGLGITFISKLGILDELRNEQLKLIPIQGIQLDRFLYVVYLRNEPLTNLAQTFIEFARQSTQDLVPPEFII
jgi:DNA-binding transcriptional LysR family regulator